MFVDAVVGNLLVMAVGQAFAWLYLRTGRFWVGTVATMLLWVAADWWLVGRYLLDAAPSAQRVPVLLLQATALATTAGFLWAMARRRRGARLREQRHRDGTQQLLSGAHEPAQQTYRALCWADPWDAAAWIGRGDALRRGGDARAARRCYARARAVDVRRVFPDLVAHRLQLLDAAAARAADLRNGPAVGPRPPAQVGRTAQKVPGNTARSAS